MITRKLALLTISLSERGTERQTVRERYRERQRQRDRESVA